MSWILDKTKEEVRDYAGEMRASWERKTWKERIVHFPVDLFVEAYRRMPYTLGHVTFIVLVLDLVFR